MTGVMEFQNGLINLFCPNIFSCKILSHGVLDFLILHERKKSNPIKDNSINVD